MSMDPKKKKKKMNQLIVSVIFANMQDTSMIQFL